MRIISVITALAMGASVTLGGCQGTQDLATIEAQVQALAVQACGFLPLAETIAAILTANASLPASAIAAAICQAVSNVTPPAKPKLTEALIIVNGKTIKVMGYFVQ